MSDPAARRSIVISTLLGLVFGVAVTSQVVDLDAPPALLALAALAGALVGAALFYAALRWVLLPTLAAFSPRARWLWLLGCLLAGFYLVWTIPLQPYQKPQVIKLTATGEKDTAAKSSEVWLESITTGDQAIPLHMDDCRGAWTPMNTHFQVSTRDKQPANLVCTIGALDDITLHFLEHEWSGKVQVKYGSFTDTLDLYSAQGGGEDLTLPVTPTPRDRWIQSLLFIVDGITVAALLLVWMLFWVQRPVKAVQPRPARLLRGGAYATFLILIWMVYLLAFWPGGFTPDSVDQYNQVISGEYVNWHPAIHTLMLAATARIWFSPASMVILQIIVQAVVLAWGFVLLEDRGVPRWATMALAVFLAFSPGVALILLTPWKDVPYTIAVLALCFMILHLFSRPAERVGAGYWVALTGVAILVALLRQNGPAVAFGTLLLLALALRRPPALMALAIAIVAVLLIVGPIYDAFGIKKTLVRQGNNVNVFTSNLLFPTVYLLKVHQLAGTPLLPEEEAFLDAVLPGDGSGEMAFGLLKGKEALVLRSALRLTLQDPGVSLSYFRTKISFIFQILQPENVRLGYAGDGVTENPFGFKEDPKLPGLKPLADRISAASKRPVFDWFFWRNAFWMYLALASALIAAVRLRSAKILLLVVPLLLNAAPLALFTGGHLARYIYPTLILGPLFGIGLLWLQPGTAPADMRR